MYNSQNGNEILTALYNLVFDPKVEGEIPDRLKNDETFRRLYDTLLEFRQALLCMGSGDLNFPVQSKGYLSGTVKTLQASLRHLTWQTKMVAKGDFSQKVDFMGDFSVAFNSMTTALKTAVDTVKANEEKYRLLTEYASDVIWVLNLTQHKFTYISPAIYNLRGITAEEALRENIESTVRPEHLESFKTRIIGSLKKFKENPHDDHSDIFELQQPRGDGSYVWVEFSANFRYTEEGEIEMVGVSRNIEKRKKNESQVIYLSYHDQLTGLYNRAFYEQEIQRLNTEENLPLSLVVADVNGLKLTNDAFGHQAGDELLKVFASILNETARIGDVIARIGGDEFTLLLPKTDFLHAERIVKDLKAKIDAVRLDKTILSVSFGVGTKTDPAENLNAVFKRAEDSMYHKKLLENKRMQSETVKLINTSLYENNARERPHSERVSKLCMETGLFLGLTCDQINELGILGLFHDIGKITINKDILNKPEMLSPEEWTQIRRHPEIGYQILRSTKEFAVIAEYVLSHHERMDGKGYPRRLTSDQIPLQARILCIADAFDSMTNTYPYRAAMTPENAAAEIRKHAGTQFDPRISEIFIEKVVLSKSPKTYCDFLFPTPDNLT